MKAGHTRVVKSELLVLDVESLDDPFGGIARNQLESLLPNFVATRRWFRAKARTIRQVEIEDALVPAFIIEEFDDGRFTVFVPSAPTPLSGSVYILTPERVHLLDISFTTAVKSLSRWGSGSKELVAAMKSRKAA